MILHLQIFLQRQKNGKYHYSFTLGKRLVENGCRAIMSCTRSACLVNQHLRLQASLMVLSWKSSRNEKYASPMVVVRSHTFYRVYSKDGMCGQIFVKLV